MTTPHAPRSFSAVAVLILRGQAADVADRGRLQVAVGKYALL
jgi:hypothetical protein